MRRLSFAFFAKYLPLYLLYNCQVVIIKSFQEIQTELKTCQERLQDGTEKIISIIKPGDEKKYIEKVETPVLNHLDHESNSQAKQRYKVITEVDQVTHVDEVFEAFIDRDAPAMDCLAADVMSEEEKKKTGLEKKQSRKVLQELKTVLVSKQEEWKVREARALARQQGKAESENEHVVTHRQSLDDDSLLDDSLGCDNEPDVTVPYTTSDKAVAANHQHCPAGVSFSDSSSDSDSGLELLGRNKLFRRPLRPAATKHLAPADRVRGDKQGKTTDRQGETTDRPARHNETSDRQLNIQPVGFDSR